MKSITNIIYNFLSSSKMMMFYMITLVVVLAVATFMDAGEAMPPSNYVNELIFQKKWFELIFVLLAINFFFHIFKYKLIQRKMWSTLFLHLSFVVIIIGAAITRYYGFEGLMNIREGGEVNTFYSLKPFLKTSIDTYENGDATRQDYDWEKALLSPRFKKNKEFSYNVNGEDITITVDKFLDKAVIESFVDTDKGLTSYLKLVESSTGKRKDHFIPADQNVIIDNLLISFSDLSKDASINIFEKDNSFFIFNRVAGKIRNMSSGEETVLESNSTTPLQLLSLYTFSNTQFVIPEPVKQGTLEELLVKDDSSNTYGARLLVSSKDTTATTFITAQTGLKPKTKFVNVGKHFVSITLGSKPHVLPYSVRLNDFQAEKYPGTLNTYKSFKSLVSVFDETVSDHEIYMNHILNYKGYRFFQTSFDSDEKGTVLSVNHDFWGSLVSYIGYSLLFTSMICIFFEKNSRAKFLQKQMKKINKQKATLTLALLLSFSAINAQTTVSETDQTIFDHSISETASNVFSEVIIQDENGRMKPVNTYGSELLRKISKKGEYKEIDANQAVLSFIQYPEDWLDVKLIKLKKGNDQLREILEIPIEDDYASLNDFYYGKSGGLKIPNDMLEKASKGLIPSKFEKDIMRAFQYQYLLGRSLGGELFRFFPIPNDDNNKWVTYEDLKFTDFVYFNGEFKELTKQIFEEQNTSDEVVIEFAHQLQEVQQKYGKEVVPSNAQVKMEILYNKLYVFQNLMMVYLIGGILMIILAVVDIFDFGNWVKYILKGLKWTMILACIIHIVGLAVRWYISEHAPWSDAYEAIVYVGLMTMVFGLVLGKKSNLIIGAAAFVASMILLIAHFNFVDPAIANLVPVLDSYWLMIHVAIIVASYGPFTLSMMLGIIFVLISILPHQKTNQKLRLALKEITVVNELSITVGVVLLTIGNFLGGMWANESWGRYWGWDPKETWALISILVYSIILHFRLIPGLKSKLALNIASIYGFYSITMTFFGVNFYLTGLHSYASGEKTVTPKIIWISFAIVTTISLIAFLKERNSRTNKGQGKEKELETV